MVRYLIILLILLLMLILKQGLRKYSIKKAGKAGERYALEEINKIRSDSNTRVFSNVKLPLYDGTTEIDLLLVIPQGIICVENKHLVGKIIGNQDDKWWLQIKKHEKKRFYNPIMQNEGHIKCLRHHLNKKGFSKVDIYGYIIFSNEKTELVKRLDNVGSLDDFRTFYNKLAKRKATINVKEVSSFVDNVEK